MAIEDQRVQLLKAYLDENDAKEARREQQEKLFRSFDVSREMGASR